MEGDSQRLMVAPAVHRLLGCIAAAGVRPSLPSDTLTVLNAPAFSREATTTSADCHRVVRLRSSNRQRTWSEQPGRQLGVRGML